MATTIRQAALEKLNAAAEGWEVQQRGPEEGSSLVFWSATRPVGRGLGMGRLSVHVSLGGHGGISVAARWIYIGGESDRKARGQAGLRLALEHLREHPALAGEAP